jgi:hypothetical protein
MIADKPPLFDQSTLCRIQFATGAVISFNFPQGQSRGQSLGESRFELLAHINALVSHGTRRLDAASKALGDRPTVIEHSAV